MLSAMNQKTHKLRSVSSRAAPDFRNAPDVGVSETRSNRLALCVIVIGVLIAAADSTIVVLALPEIQRSLRTGLASVVWVIIGYLLVITILCTQVGRLGDMFGRVRMYKAGFLLFVLGSVACALAWNEASLVAFRVIQGVGGALITANSGAIIADTFPPSLRGRAYGFLAVGFNTGAALGVVAGGLIVTYISWRWIFWVNAPIGILALVFAQKSLADKESRSRTSIDWLGMFLLAIGLFGVLWAMVKLTTQSFDLPIGGYFVGGTIVLGLCWWIEHRVAHPMLDLRVFRVPTMTPSLLAALFQYLANFAVLFLLLMYLQGVRGLTPIHASLLLTPGFVVGGIVGPISGRFADRIGTVIPATFGLAVQTVTLIVYAQFGQATPYWIVLVMFIIGIFGGACFFPANSAAVMKAATDIDRGVTSGLLRMFANIGMVFSFALAIVVASQSISRHEAFAIFVGTTTLSRRTALSFTNGLHAAFYASTLLMAIAALLSASRGRRSQNALTS